MRQDNCKNHDPTYPCHWYLLHYQMHILLITIHIFPYIYPESTVRLNFVLKYFTCNVIALDISLSADTVLTLLHIIYLLSVPSALILFKNWKETVLVCISASMHQVMLKTKKGRYSTECFRSNPPDSHNIFK